MDRSEAWQLLEAAAARAAMRGSLIFHLDLATELARPLLPDDPDLLVATLADAEGYRVEAMTDAAAPVVRATVRFADDGRPVATRAARPASPVAEALARARRTIEQSEAGGAVVVIPPPRDSNAGAIEAYALTLAPNRGDVVVGPHWRLTLADGGRRVAAREPLTRSALVLPGRGDLPPLSAEVTHFGAVPGEIHTYLSLKHGLPIDILALESAVRWRVDGERTTIAGVIPPSAPAG